MIPVTQSDILKSTQEAWRAVFGKHLPPLTTGAPSMDDPILIARVRILDETSQSILVICPAKGAKLIAAGFFGRAASAIDTTLVHDVFGEIANMIGGLIKRHFPLTAKLSLPDVTEGTDRKDADVILQAHFACGAGTPLAVRLVQNLS
jgi:hypothetical protein